MGVSEGVGIGINGTVKSVTLPKAEQDASFRILVSGGGGQGFYNLSIQDPEGDNNDENNENKNQNDQEKEKDQQENQKQQQQGSRTMREMIESLDSNDENLEAEEAARKNPLGDSRPDKDW